MKIFYKPGKFLIATLWVLFFSGCAMYDNKYSYSKAFVHHRSEMVRYPAQAGFIAGFLAGWPVEIMLGPVIMLFEPSNRGSMSGEENEYYSFKIELAASFILGALGQNALGGPCWLLFGWWWLENKVEQPNPPPEQKTEQALTGVTKKNTNRKSP